MNMHSSQVQQVLRLVVLAWTMLLATAKLSDYIDVCNINDPDLNGCIVRKTDILLPSLIKGLKEFGLPSLNPLIIPVMQIEEGTGSVGLAFNITDSKHYGWTTTKMTAAKADPKNHHFEFDFTVPKYAILGDYEVKGRILVLPIRGNGPCNMTLENVNTTVVLDGKLEERNGESYFTLTKVKCWFTASKIHVRFDNLFGNKQLSDAMNDFLNQNSKEAFTELKPAIDEVFSEIISSFLERMFSKVPYNQLFKLD